MDLSAREREAVSRLDAIDPDIDPEHAHDIADKVLVSVAPPAVQEAYTRLVERSPWWATA